MSTLTVKTTWGNISIGADKGFITSCDLPYLAAKPAKAFKAISSSIKATSDDDRKELTKADEFLRGITAGKPVTLPRVAIPESAPFIQRAWKAMLAVPPGRAITYTELAKKAGSPRAVRAAGQACAKNQIPLFIPCHRILAKGGRLGGFSCGLPWKEFLLEREGFVNRG